MKSCRVDRALGSSHRADGRTFCASSGLSNSTIATPKFRSSRSAIFMEIGAVPSSRCNISVSTASVMPLTVVTFTKRVWTGVGERKSRRDEA